MVILGAQGLGADVCCRPLVAHLLAANFGQVIPDPAHCLNVGGMPIQSDAILLEKQQAFDRSKTLERIVHPCGSSAFGTFKTTADISHITKAAFLQPNVTTPVNVRFSTGE